MYDKENLKNIKEVRIITLGEPDFGKTSIIRRFVNDIFKGDKVTLGIEFSFKIVELEGNRKIKLSVIDTNGQEKYRALPLNYFKKADVVLFVFALNDSGSFEKIGQWIDRFNNNNGKNVKKMFLIGNKSDLVKVIEQKEIDDFANKYGLTYMETSAKTKNQINELFTIIAEEAYEELERKSSMSVGTQKNKIVQKTNINNKSKSNNCC